MKKSWNQVRKNEFFSGTNCVLQIFIVDPESTQLELYLLGITSGYCPVIGKNIIFICATSASTSIFVRATSASSIWSKAIYKMHSINSWVEADEL